MKKIYLNFLSENFHLLVLKLSVYLNRNVFVMGIVCQGSNTYQISGWSNVWMYSVSGNNSK